MLSVKDIAGRRITIMGLGSHGGAIGNIKWLQAQGAKLLVTDLKNDDELVSALKQIKGLADVELVLGEHRERDFTDTDMVIRNPAVPKDSPYLQLAQQAGVPVEMDSSLFMQLYQGEVIGVTGSKGKSTVTTVLGRLLNAPVIGIEGTSPLAILSDNPPRVVFELSSWRLEALADKKISPPVAVVTSLYRDHLNTYQSFAQYKETKKTILQYQTRDAIAILNSDDEKLLAWQEDIKGQLFWFGLVEKREEGIYVKDDQVVVRRDGQEEAVLAREIIPLRMDHELRNVLPGLLLAHLKGIDKEAIIKRVATLRSLPHRMEGLGEIGGAVYINDSAATVPDATIAALQSLAGKRIIHILGGNDKKLDFAEWADYEAAAQVGGLIWLKGNATHKMKQALSRADVHCPSEDVADMAEAVAVAATLAKRGDVVLLSPGATSFGSFKNEFDRGDKFKAAVENLKKKSV